MSGLFPAFLKLLGRPVLVVGAGPVAASKLDSLLAAKASVTVVAPEVLPEIVRPGVRILRRRFVASDVHGVFLIIAAATPEVNREVAAVAEARGVFVNAVDDPENASLYLGGVVRRGGVTLAVSTDGQTPALAGLLREALEAVLPDEVGAWLETARSVRRAQKAEGLPMSERRPRLLTALNELYAARGRGDPCMSGFVSLVGAGPGDPELLTVKAVRALAQAELVLYDALVAPETLALAGTAQKFSVGKRCGRPAIRQESIHALLIRAARRGKRVVRLKGGDPFVFGRGGEEALALAAAGIAFEVVPGLTNAVVAPALAGIPVTHRGLASAFVVVSGHDEAAFRPVLEGLTPGSATVVVLMGLASRGRLAEWLIERGWSAATPAAILFGAGTARAFTWRGTLAGLALADLAQAAGLPGTLVIGAVVALAGVISRCVAHDQAAGAFEEQIHARG